MKKGLILFALLLPIIIAVFAFNINFNNKNNHSVKDINPFQTASLAVETFYITGKGWGFDIYVDGKSFIHHEKIEISDIGNGYENEQDAVKVAQLVMHKIRCNKLPPIISINELDSLGVKF